MKPTTEILARISQNSLANKEEVFTKLYRYLLRPDIYFVAYKNLYANNGAATKGVNEDMVRSVDVARHMEVSKPSVCHAVATLRDGGFLTMDEDHFLHLTDVGREVAEKIYERHCFFTEQLIAAGVDPKTAEADACRIEHIISDESFSRLKEAAAQEQE